MAPISRNGTEPSCANRRACQQLGFSLAELLIALTIVVLIGAALSPLLLPSPARTINAAAGEVVVALRETRRLAQATRQSRELVIDTESMRFMIDAEPWRPLPDGSTAEVTTAQSLISDDDTAAIAFFPDGSSSGGRVKLGLEGHTAQVDVDWLTGRIRLADGSK
jgi:general secretion pathway protein H